MNPVITSHRTSAAEGLITDAEARDLIGALLDIREQVSRAHRFGLTLTIGTLEHKARDLAAAFVDPAGAFEALEQLNAERRRVGYDDACGF